MIEPLTTFLMLGGMVALPMVGAIAVGIAQNRYRQWYLAVKAEQAPGKPVVIPISPRAMACVVVLFVGIAMSYVGVFTLADYVHRDSSPVPLFVGWLSCCVLVAALISVVVLAGLSFPPDDSASVAMMRQQAQDEKAKPAMPVSSGLFDAREL